MARGDGGRVKDDSGDRRVTREKAGSWEVGAISTGKHLGYCEGADRVAVGWPRPGLGA